MGREFVKNDAPWGADRFSNGSRDYGASRFMKEFSRWISQDVSGKQQDNVS